MLSILGKYDYSFPHKVELKLRLKDLLESEVDEKYYLSESHIERIAQWNSQEKPLEDIKPDRICSCVTTHCGKDSGGMQLVGIQCDTGVILLGGIGEKNSNNGTQYYMQDRIYSSDAISPIIPTGFNPYFNQGLRIRKLTPLECCRLMDLPDDVDYKLKNAGISDAQRYHIYGDGLVCKIPELIVKELYE